MAKIDATENEVDGLEISGFPTILFYRANNKVRPLKFDDDRSEKGLLQFLK